MTATVHPAAAEGAYDALLVSLYRGAREYPVAEFQARAFRSLRALIPFDGGFWSTASVEQDKFRPYSNWIFELPQAIEQAWAPLEDRDVLGRMAFLDPGRTICVVAREMTSDPVLIEQIVEPFGLEHVMATGRIDPLTSLASAIAICRGRSGPPFSEAERRLKERITPHLIEAFSTNRLYHLLGARRSTSQSDEASAACDREALLHIANGEFTRLMSLEWPSWRGPRLPPPLADCIRREQPGPDYHGDEITVCFETANDQTWLRARPKKPADDLSPRMAQVARMSASGLSNKEIARELGISPNTVRNQLNAVYRKLGVATRTELSGLFSELDRF